MYWLTVKSTTDQGRRLDGRVSVLLAMTAAMTVKLLQAIFVPIVHNTSLKSAGGGKNISKTLIIK